MAESILVTGKRISDMELVTVVSGSEKVPTGQAGDLALTPDQIAEHTVVKHDLANQEDLSQVQLELQTQIDDVSTEVTNQSNSIRALLNQEIQDRIDGDDELRADIEATTPILESLRQDLTQEVADRIAADALKVDKEGSVVSVSGRVGIVALDPSDIGYPTLEVLDKRQKLAEYIVDESGKNQQEVNDYLVDKSQRDNETIYDYGAVGDGTLHTVQEWYTVGSPHYRGYTSLLDVQNDYPFVTDANFSSDQAAILKLSDIKASSGGGTVYLSKGVFIVKPVNSGACLSIQNGVFLVGEKQDSKIHTITDPTDLPAESVWWDSVLFSGSSITSGGVTDITFSHNGGRRNNTCTVAVRGGASRIKITGNNFLNSIGSSIGIEGSVANPIFTHCTVSGNTVKPSSRHGLYISGAKGNTATGNNFYVSALESIQNRNPSDNNISGNNFYGVSGVMKSAIMFTQPPTTETTSYQVSNYTIENNKFFDMRAAAVSSGVGVVNTFAKIKSNVIYMSDDTTTTEHALSLFRFNQSEVGGNYIEGGRNRAIALYGCSDNSLSSNNIKNVMSNTLTGGAVQMQTYTDSIDGTVTNSTGNKISGGSIVDNRATLKHVNAVNFLTGNNGNTVTKLKITGTTSATQISSVDGLDKNSIGEVSSNPIFTKASLSVGTQAATAMINASAQQFAVVESGFVQSLRMDITQTLSAGTVRCRIFKNGATFSNILLTANGSLKFVESFFQPNQLPVSRGDVLTASIECDSVTSSQTVFDTNFAVRIAE
jgi:parallel beta-helix repeat protein